MSTLWKHPHLQALSAAGALRSWTGGDRPATYQSIGSGERLTVRAFFREQMGDWLAYHGGPVSREIRKLFWARARYDAHATHRHAPAYWAAHEWDSIIASARSVRHFAPYAKRGTVAALITQRAARDVRAWARIAEQFHASRPLFNQ